MRIVNCDIGRHGCAILDILNEAIANSTALYDYRPRTMDAMCEWFVTKSAHGFPVIGIEDEAKHLLGFASYGTFRAWPAYKYSVEHSLYVHREFRGKGIGRALLTQLIAIAMEQGRHILVGGIDVDNAASIALHEKLGFVHAGTIKQAGYKFNRWLDVAFYQLILSTPNNPQDG
jgi:L-amino acid N-acyltransferase YncA